MIAGWKGKRIAALLSVLVLVCAVTVYADSTSDEIEQVQIEQEDGQSRLATTQDRIAELQEKRDNGEEYLTALTSQMSELTGELDATGQTLAEKQSELSTIRQELDQMQTEADRQYDEMKIRIQYLYENGISTGTLVSILSADSFTEALNRAENYSAITRYDREMLASYEETLASIRERENQLVQEEAELTGIQKELTERKTLLQELYQAAYNDMEGYIMELDGAEAEQGAILEELRAQEERMNELLRQQYEAEAALRAQQEAEAAAAVEAAAQQFAGETDDAEPALNNETEPAPQEPVEEPAAEETESADPEPVQEPQPEPAEPEETPESAEPEEASEPEEQETEEEPEEEPSEPETEEETPEETPEESSSEENLTFLGNFTLTAYCACPQCCGAYATGYTASGTLATAGRTVAMGDIEFGTQLMINGHIYTVEDRGTAYGHVDIFFDSHDDALAFGLQYADVYLVN